MRMIDVVRKIPSDSQRLIQSFDQICQAIGEKLDEDYEEIVLIGSGSSYNAAFLTQEFGEEVLHKKIRLYYPNVFNYHTNKEIFSKKTLFIFISQSGYTYLVHEAMKKVKDWGFSTLAITEDANSPIAQEIGQSVMHVHDLKKVVNHSVCVVGLLETPIISHQGMIKVIFMIKTKRDEDQFLYFLCDIFSLWASNPMLIETFYNKPSFELLKNQLDEIIDQL